MPDSKPQEDEAFTPIPPMESDTEVSQAPAAYDIPDGGYGWVVVTESPS